MLDEWSLVQVKAAVDATMSPWFMCEAAGSDDAVDVWKNLSKIDGG